MSPASEVCERREALPAPASPQAILPTQLARPERTEVRFSRPSRPTWGPLEAYGIIGLVLLLTARFIPLARLPFWHCTLRKATGFPCLSCGMTRAFDWFAQGRLLDSLAINPLGFSFAVAAVVGLVYLVAMPLRLPRLHVRLSDQGLRVLRCAVALVIAGNWGYLIARTLLARG